MQEVQNFISLLCDADFVARSSARNVVTIEDMEVLTGREIATGGGAAIAGIISC